MTTIRQWLNEVEWGSREVIQAIEIQHNHANKLQQLTMLPEGIHLPPYPFLEEYLDFEFHTGFASFDLPLLTIWTASWVYFIVDTDEAKSLNRVARNPPL